MTLRRFEKKADEKVIVRDNWIILELEIEGKKKRRTCGFLEDEFYIRKVYPHKDYYVLGGGYPIANAILKWLKEHNVEKIKIIEMGKKAINIYDTTTEKYIKSVMIQHGEFEQQRCVPLEMMGCVSSTLTDDWND